MVILGEEKKYTVLYYEDATGDRRWTACPVALLSKMGGEACSAEDASPMDWRELAGSCLLKFGEREFGEAVGSATDLYCDVFVDMRVRPTSRRRGKVVQVHSGQRRT
jgi:hypothetical protein